MLSFDPMSNLQKAISSHTTTEQGSFKKSAFTARAVNFFVGSIFATLSCAAHTVMLGIKIVVAIVILPFRAFMNLPENFKNEIAVKTILKHGYKVIAFAVDIVVTPVLGGIISPKHNFQLHVNCKLVVLDLPPAQQEDVQHDGRPRNNSVPPTPPPHNQPRNPPPTPVQPQQRPDPRINVQHHVVENLLRISINVKEYDEKENSESGNKENEVSINKSVSTQTDSFSTGTASITVQTNSINTQTDSTDSDSTDSEIVSTESDRESVQSEKESDSKESIELMSKKNVLIEMESKEDQSIDCFESFASLLSNPADLFDKLATLPNPAKLLVQLAQRARTQTFDIPFAPPLFSDETPSPISSNVSDDSSAAPEAPPAPTPDEMPEDFYKPIVLNFKKKSGSPTNSENASPSESNKSAPLTLEQLLAAKGSLKKRASETSQGSNSSVSSKSVHTPMDLMHQLKSRLTDRNLSLKGKIEINQKDNEDWNDKEPDTTSNSVSFSFHLNSSISSSTPTPKKFAPPRKQASADKEPIFDFKSVLKSRKVDNTQANDEDVKHSTEEAGLGAYVLRKTPRKQKESISASNVESNELASKLSKQLKKTEK